MLGASPIIWQHRLHVGNQWSIKGTKDMNLEEKGYAIVYSQHKNAADMGLKCKSEMERDLAQSKLEKKLKKE